MQPVLAVEIDRAISPAGRRNRDGRAGERSRPLAERHHQVQSVGAAALEEDDERLRRVGIWAAACSVRARKPGTIERPIDGQTAVSLRNTRGPTMDVSFITAAPKTGLTTYRFWNCGDPSIAATTLAAGSMSASARGSRCRRVASHHHSA